MPLNSFLNFLSEIVNILFIVAVLGGSGWYANYRRKNHAVKIASAPILLAYYTDGATVYPIDQGSFGDMHYSTFLTTNAEVVAQGGRTVLVYRVELPFQTTVHLMGIPRKGSETRLNPAQKGSLMERVDLEGDYSQHFDLFCEKGMQTDVRYALDPKAMLFTLNFCQSHSWEVVGNELYFVQAGENRPDDPTPMRDDIQEFVSQIQPAIAKPLTDTQKAKMTPYGQDRRTDLQCPLCQAALKNTEDYFVCPSGHGVLLTGAKLVAVKKGSLQLPALVGKAPERTANLHCPSCGNEMSQVAFDGGATTIDSCSHCPYRWLDAGELTKPAML